MKWGICIKKLELLKESKKLIIDTSNKLYRDSAIQALNDILNSNEITDEEISKILSKNVLNGSEKK